MSTMFTKNIEQLCAARTYEQGEDEDANGVIRSRKSENGIQYKCYIKKEKRENNDLQYISHRKLSIEHQNKNKQTNHG